MGQLVEFLHVGRLRPGAKQGAAAFVVLVAVFLWGGDVLGVGVAVAHHQHLVHRHAQRLGQLTANAIARHDGGLARQRGQVQIAHPHQLQRQHFGYPGVRLHQPHRNDHLLGPMALPQAVWNGKQQAANRGQEGVGGALLRNAGAGAVFGAAGCEAGAQRGWAGGVNLAVRGVGAAHLHAAHVDEAHAVVHFAAQDLVGVAGQFACLVGLALSDDAGVLELVLGGAAARFQVQVGAHVPGVGLRERGHEGLAIGAIAHPRHVVLPVVGRIPLVVATDQGVGVGHAGAVGGEQAQGPHSAPGLLKGQHRHQRVDLLRKDRAILRRVAAKRG